MLLVKPLTMVTSKCTTQKTKKQKIELEEIVESSISKFFLLIL